MRGKNRPRALQIILIAASIMQIPVSCTVPFVWNADLRSFVENGLSVVSLRDFSARIGGVEGSIIPSGSQTVVTLTITNPRSIEISGNVAWEDDSLFDSLPELSVVGPEELSLSFTPSLQAERKDLAFMITITSPALNRTYPPVKVIVHCNTPPGCVESSLDAALDENGCAFAAFRLPSSATDNDLSRVEIIYAPADGSGNEAKVTLAVDEACLCIERTSVDGIDLLGTDHACHRYYQPVDLISGDDYLFKVVLIDTEGLRSVSAEITTSADRYSVIYDGNGNTGGTAPVDNITYRQTKDVTAMSPGTGPDQLVRTGYSFTGWNTAANGTGNAYAAGEIFRMPAANLVLYAQWSINSYTISFDGNSPDASSVTPQTGDYDTDITLPEGPTRTGYTFTGWNTAADGSGTAYAAGDTYRVGAANAALYAQWSINSYTVSFDSQGGSAVGSLTGTYGSILSLPAGPTLAGYTFTSWNAIADGSGTPYTAGADFTVPAGDAMLYAQWIENDSVVVSFTLNPSYGAITFVSSTVSLARGDTLTLTTALLGATDWHWYRDGVPDGTQTTSTFSWNTTGAQPGQYIINVDAVYGGYACTGSIRVTVSY